MKVFLAIFFLVALLKPRDIIGAEALDENQGAIVHNTSSGTIGIPEHLSSPLGSYPNLLGITESERRDFEPVVRFPNRPIPVKDNSNVSSLGTPEEIALAKQRNKWWRKWSRVIVHRLVAMATLGSRRPGDTRNSTQWNIGKYDENRLGMYTSELFQDEANSIDGYGGHRTLHLGVDIGCPAGTKVYAFTDGVVHSAGYNADHGDYGHVVVVEHHLDSHNNETRKVWALYGHMDTGTTRGKKAGTRIRKGQVIGRVGDCHENGGWSKPHVHFQLSMKPPETHDMPGASSLADRSSALMDYPDPRYILGAVH